MRNYYFGTFDLMDLCQRKSLLSVEESLLTADSGLIRANAITSLLKKKNIIFMAIRNCTTAI